MINLILHIVIFFSLFTGNFSYAFNQATYASIVINEKNSQIIQQTNAYKARYPASLTKMMTIHLVLDAIKNRKITMDTKMLVSPHAASQPRSKLELKTGEKISVQNAINALIIRSANDVAVVVAEHLAGSEEDFVRLMNKKAAQLNMHNTHFANPHGLYDENQFTTAYDMAILVMALKNNHPKYYHLFKKTSFRYKGQIINTHNRLVKNNSWIHGMKTGFISSSGFNVATTAHRPEGQLVAVVMGGTTSKERDNHMLALLNSSYNHLTGSAIKPKTSLTLAKHPIKHKKLISTKQNQHKHNIYYKHSKQ